MRNSVRSTPQIPRRFLLVAADGVEPSSRGYRPRVLASRRRCNTLGSPGRIRTCGGLVNSQAPCHLATGEHRRLPGQLGRTRTDIVRDRSTAHLHFCHELTSLGWLAGIRTPIAWVRARRPADWTTSQYPLARLAPGRQIRIPMERAETEAGAGGWIRTSVSAIRSHGRLLSGHASVNLHGRPGRSRTVTRLQRPSLSNALYVDN